MLVLHVLLLPNDVVVAQPLPSVAGADPVGGEARRFCASLIKLIDGDI